MVIIWTPDAFLINMSRYGSVSVAISGGRYGSMLIHAVHDRAGPWFAQHGCGAS